MAEAQRQEPDMTTATLYKFAAALRSFMSEQEYARQIQARIEVLEQAGLRFSPEELSKVARDMNATGEKQL